MTSEQDIARAEEELDRLAAQLETVVAASDFPKAVLAIGHRARSLFLANHTSANAARLVQLRPSWACVC